ncbi:Large ribosomal RNA subunit accumulation protein YceD protein [Dioscorea alata]|uniref:Large ribosomal RNA subunit accumulation protein YceD protein n=1 Tax=Dioscorea alata TaxID=55571 RepID=A0ACB7V7E8_DIOAL|nr:Large ribosomal RNA subunit accumulation protein YceD protein [Dioscorea alata]
MALLLPSPLKPIATLATNPRHRFPPNPNLISQPPKPFLSSFQSFSSSSIPIKPLFNSPIFSKFTEVSDITDFSAVSDDLDDDEALASSPWEGAIVYRRDASVTHLEFATTLERLGLTKLSTALSRSRASTMGIRLPSRKPGGSSAAAGDDGTPVLISIDVTRRKRKLKLDGIVRTVITLGCNRCAEPAAEIVFKNFTLLLTEDPVEESEEINLGVIYGEDKGKPLTGSGNEEEEDDEKQIDIDDRLHFPSEEKEIDISKHIRDIVHVEITISAICDASCKGLCLQCGVNLNRKGCTCSKKNAEEKQYGPLKDLGKQMQRR